MWISNLIILIYSFISLLLDPLPHLLYLLVLRGWRSILKDAKLPRRLLSLPLSVRYVQTHTHTHACTPSSNYGNQQADPISVSCFLSPWGWLPDHLTLHNLICNDRVWHSDFWPYQQLVSVYVCETPTHVWLQFTCTKLLPEVGRFNWCEFWIQGRSSVSGCDSVAATLLLWVSPLSELVKVWWTSPLVCILWGEAKHALLCSPWSTWAAHRHKHVL